MAEGRGERGAPASIGAGPTTRHASAQGLADAAERALRGGALFEESGGSTPFVLALNVLLLADRVEPVRDALEEGLEHARHRGSRWAFAWASGWRCWLLAREGTLAEAEADARSCAEVSLAEGWFAAAPPMLGFALAVLIERGELEDAEQLLEQAAIPDRLLHEDASFDTVLHARARIRAARGDLETARSDLARLGRRRARWNTFPALVPALLVAPELVAGELDAERRRAKRMLSEAHTWGTPRASGMALHAAGLAEAGKRSLELLSEAVATLEASPARVEHARALGDLGAALRRANRREEAREPLRQALDITYACGARPLAEHARHELRAAGGRPRRPRSSGAEALTASERRVAAMAADGLSNPEIAQALFVTKKTVEAHLGSTYRKLGIASRTELAAALERSGEPA